MTATSFLREVFRADLVGIWHVDLSGTGSYCLADSPAAPEGFHDYAIGHPLIGELRRTGALSPIQGSEMHGADVVPERGGHCLAIPLHVSDRQVRTVAIVRALEGYTPQEVLLAGSLQPILGGIWTVPETTKEATTSA